MSRQCVRWLVGPSRNTWGKGHRFSVEFPRFDKVHISAKLHSRRPGTPVRQVELLSAGGYRCWSLAAAWIFSPLGHKWTGESMKVDGSWNCHGLIEAKASEVRELREPGQPARRCQKRTPWLDHDNFKSKLDPWELWCTVISDEIWWTKSTQLSRQIAVFLFVRWVLLPQMFLGQTRQMSIPPRSRFVCWSLPRFLLVSFVSHVVTWLKHVKTMSQTTHDWEWFIILYYIHTCSYHLFMVIWLMVYFYFYPHYIVCFLQVCCVNIWCCASFSVGGIWLLCWNRREVESDEKLVDLDWQNPKSCWSSQFPRWSGSVHWREQPGHCFIKRTAVIASRTEFLPHVPLSVGHLILWILWILLKDLVVS